MPAVPAVQLCLLHLPDALTPQARSVLAGGGLRRLPGLGCAPDAPLLGDGTSGMIVEFCAALTAVLML